MLYAGLYSSFCYGNNPFMVGYLNKPESKDYLKLKDRSNLPYINFLNFVKTKLFVMAFLIDLYVVLQLSLLNIRLQLLQINWISYYFVLAVLSFFDTIKFNHCFYCTEPHLPSRTAEKTGMIFRVVFISSPW